MKKFLIKTLSVLCIVVFAVFTGGVSAGFYYSQAVPNFAGVSIDLFVSDNFSGGLFVNIDQGLKHDALVRNILNGTSSHPNIGLNSPNSYLNRQISSRYATGYSHMQIIGNADFWADTEMEKFLVEGAENMHFILYFPNGHGEEYYLYGTTVNVNNVSTNSWINPVVKTTLRKNEDGMYVAVKVEQGRARCRYYQQPYTGGNLIRAKTINHTSFERT